MSRKGLNIYHRKDGRWEGRYIKSRTPDGKNVYGYVYGYKFTEVKDMLMPLKAESTGLLAMARTDFRGSFADWLIYWLQNVIKPNARPATYASYFNKTKKHIIPALGEKRMDKLTEAEVQGFVNALSQKGLAANSVRAVYRVLNASLSKAVSSHYILFNPCKETRLPQAELAKVSALTLGQQKALENIARGDRDGVAVMLALYTGMRIGEICALQWSDIDFERRMISVGRTMERLSAENGEHKTEIVFGMPKTTSSYRAIPLPEHLAEYLTRVKALADSAFVVSCKGSFAEPRITRYRFHKMLEEANLPMVRFHALRHTFATRCIERGVDVTTLSRLLGHKSPKLTLDTYTDSMLEQQKLAMRTLDKLFALERTKPGSPNIIQAKTLLPEYVWVGA